MRSADRRTSSSCSSAEGTGVMSMSSTGRPHPADRAFASVRAIRTPCREEQSMSDVTTIEADVPERYADAVSDPFAAGRRRGRRRSYLAQGRDAVGAGGHAGGHEPARLAGHRRAREGAARRLRRASPSACAPRATATRSCSAWAARASPPRSSASPSASSTRGLTLHVLDSTHPAEVREVLNSIDLDRALDDRLIEVRRDDRADVDVQGLPRAPGRRLALRRGHRPRLEPRRRSPTSTASAASSTATRTSAGATARCSAFGLVPAAAAGIDVAGDPRLRDRRRRGVPRRARQRRPVARLRARRARPPGPRQAHVRRRRPADAATASGPSSCGPSRPARRARGILPIADEPLLAPEAYGDDRVFLHIALDDAENASKLAALKDAGHPVITIRALGPNDLGRIFFLSEFAVAVAGWVLEINPFDQPNVQEAKDNTNRVLKEGSPGLEEGSLSELTDGPRAARLLRDHGLPAVLRRDRGRRRAPARRR